MLEMEQYSHLMEKLYFYRHIKESNLYICIEISNEMNNNNGIFIQQLLRDRFTCNIYITMINSFNGINNDIKYKNKLSTSKSRFINIILIGIILVCIDIQYYGIHR